jgi:phenylalanyl-tRNA synthetase beta chain
VTADPQRSRRRLTARGLTVDAVTEVDGDTVFDIDVPANRPDALGHLGVAREVAAAFGTHLTEERPGFAGSGASAGDTVQVTIESPELCGRYTAGVVRGVRVGASPAAVVQRLQACGLRSINNVVDVSNLVMLALGQPVHFFDLATVSGPAIRVRRANPGETLTTSTVCARVLDREMLVIADAERAVGLGGVIGGAATEITERTVDVLVEAASFLPASVRRTARALGVSTDASQRFERGVDPDAPLAAQRLAARLLAELAGGIPAPETLDVRPRPASPRALSVRLPRAARLLGYAPRPEEAREALSAVGLAPRLDGDVFYVEVPSWRVDLEREADLVEEIGRHLGYDRIPSHRPAAAPPAAASSGADLEEAVRDRLAGLGFSEALTYAMIGSGDDDAFVPADAPAPIALNNPIAETLGVLRRSIAPGLLRAADQNLRRGASDVRLFEVGHVFFSRGEGRLPDEPLHVAFAWAGSAAPAHWSEPARVADPFDAAGIVEDLLASRSDAWFTKHPASLGAIHPGRSIEWHDPSGRRVAWCGPVHPALAARLDVPGSILLGEIDLVASQNPAPAPTSYRPIPRFPAAFRDLSIVLEPHARAGAVIQACATVLAPAPASFTWLDRYAGAPLEPDKRR